jgi:DNA-binding transcriptional regulator YiaG
LRHSRGTEDLVMFLIRRGQRNHDIERDLDKMWSTQDDAYDRRVCITMEDIQKIRKKFNLGQYMFANEPLAISASELY